VEGDRSEGRCGAPGGAATYLYCVEWGAGSDAQHSKSRRESAGGWDGELGRQTAAEGLSSVIGAAV
jgi:hypothetical protein